MTKIKKNFWKNKKILITGIDGFVGSNLAKKLIALKANVYGIVKKKRESLIYFENLNKKCRILKGKLENFSFLKKIISKNKFTFIFHLAAQVEVGVANKSPFNTWESNIRGTYNLLEILNKYNYAKSIIVASSDKAYGSYDKNLLPYRETYLPNPIYPYDVSKACADFIARSYSSKLFNLPIITTRFSNIYGPGQLHFSALIPDLMRSLITGRKFIPRGDGNDIRDYVYILDIVNLYLILAENLSKKKQLSGQIFNAGNNQPFKIKQIVKKIFYFKNKKKEFEHIEKKMKKKKTTGEIKYQYMDFSKLNKFFKWKPMYKFEDTIQETYNWYENYFNKNKFIN